MKAKFLALAALVLGLASCQTDPQDLDVTTGGEQAVTINVALPEEVTRATGTDSAIGGIGNVDATQYDLRYILEVYDADGTNKGELAKERIVNYTDATTTSTAFDLRLVPGRAYRFVVWADFVAEGASGQAAEADLHYDTTDGLRAVQVIDTQWTAIDESRDAYTGIYDVDDFSSASPIDIMTLKRPFAKLRVVTDDLDEMISVRPTEVKVEYFSTNFYNTFDAFESAVVEGDEYVTAGKVLTVNLTECTYNGGLDNPQEGVQTLFADYFFGTEDDSVKFYFDVKFNEGNNLPQVTFNTNIPVKRNNLTTIYGPILTDANNVKVTIDSKFENQDNPYDAPYYVEHKEASNAQELIEIFNEVENATGETHIVLTDDIDLNDLFNLTRANENVLPIVIKNGTTVELDLNEKVLSATTNADSGNQELFLVKGKLTVKNGTIEYEHVGQNMGWGAMTTIFDVTAGGILNLEGVTATNKGGSDMGFVAHLNNWGEVTLNVDNCTLESNYVPVRVFNSGYDMNNVTIKNSTLKGGSAAFWVHNYTAEDFGSEAKAESQKALLNFDIFDNSNTFSPIVGIRYGFTNSIRFDSYGITRTVSEDGTIVTLDKFFGEGVVRRGVVGNEENTTIKKVVVGEGISTLYDRTFRRFYALEEVVLPSTLTTIGAAGSGVFQSCTALKSIVIPESVTVLGKGSFQECSSLTSINIPAGVTRIEENCLRATGLVSVEFHAGVTYFGAQAFRDCKQLTEVIINAPEFTMENNTFGIMAAPFTPMTIRVANAEMKAYVESMLTDHAKTYITVKAPVAMIGEKGYATLAKAVAAVEDGGTITLVENEVFTENNYYDNGGWKDGLGYAGDKSFTLDLNNYTISQNGALNDYLLWFKNVGSKANTITIKNGTLDAGTSAYCALCTASSHDNQLTINLENVNLINNKSNGSTIKVRAGSVVNVKAGTKITGKNSYLGIENWNATVNVYDGAEIYMNGTSSYNGCLVGVGGNGVINVYGGYGKGVKGGFIAMTSGGTINVSGGEWIANTDGTIGDNSNLYVLTAQNNKYESGYAGASIINVTGGTFRGGMDAWILNDVNTEKAELNIKGGNFNANPAAYVVKGYEAVEENGIYTVGKPKALAAFEAAIAQGGNVTLSADITLLESVVIEGKKVVLDLNGKTVNAPLFSAFEVKSGAELTIKNGKVVAYESTVRAIGGKAIIESGEYTSTGTAVDSPATKRYSLDCREGGELIINGGTFKSNNGMINVGSTVTINGGKFENIVEKTMTRHFAYVSAALTINDGEFYGQANSSGGGCFFCGAGAGGDIQVKGGKFTSLWTSGSVNRIFEVYFGGKINVTGGMFNTNGGIATFVTENTDEATKAAYPYVAK